MNCSAVAILAILVLSCSGAAQITIAECKDAGGTVWIVEKSHPEVCPSCSPCEKCRESGNFTTCESCKDCSECMIDFPAEYCPEGKGSIAEISDMATWARCCR